MSDFFDHIRSKKIAHPTQRTFSLKKWHQFWDSIKDTATRRDKEIYQFGIIINSLLVEIRHELKILYETKTPNIKNNQLLIAYIGLSNRDRNIAFKHRPVTENSYSSTISSTLNGDELTLQEISEGSVDGLEKAIYFCVTRMKNSKEIRSGKKPLDEISFISLESHLSQLYSAYENHWHCMLWLKFNLIEFDTEKKIYILEQPKSELEVACEVSQIRKSRLASHQASITSSPEIQQFYNNDKYLSIVRKGRKKTLKCLSISNSDDEIKYINSNWKTATLFLQDNFEINTLKSSHNNGFSIIEALDVFRLLILLSTILIRRFPEDDSVYNFKKSSEFCPKIKKKDLINSTARATGLELKKIENIIDFIEYKALKKQDLSCHPIIKISESHYGILTSALVAPVITRIVEHWLVALDIDLQSKGKIYEDIILKNLNDAVRENKTIINFDDAVSRRIKLKNGAEEEIDLIMKIGNLILIGEAKSIVTTDSPISNYRTLETLRYASEQALRKTKFVKNNILDVFKKLDWIFSPETEYSFVNFIINSGRIYVGHNINGVPICDEKILIKYFTDNNIPLLSITDEKTQRHKHLAWIDLYNNFENLQSNLLSYLIDPPQIVDTMEHFDYKYNRLPYINKNSYKVVFKRLVIKDIPIMERLKPKKFVNMKKCHDFDNEIKKIDITI